MASFRTYIFLVVAYISTKAFSAPPMQQQLQLDNFEDLFRINAFSNDVSSSNQRTAFDNAFNDNNDPLNYLTTANANPSENLVNTNDNKAFSGGFNTPYELQEQSSSQHPISLQTLFLPNTGGFQSPEVQQLGLGNFELPLASTEDIHTNSDVTNAFGISLQSNDGINTIRDTKIIPSPIPVTLVDSRPSEDHLTNEQTFGISLPASIAGTSSAGESSNSIIVVEDDSPFGIPDLSRSSDETQEFGSFGIPLPSTGSPPDFSNTDITTISDSDLTSISDGLQTDVSLNSLIEGSSNNQGDSANLESIVNSLTVQNSDKSSSQVLESLGDLTIGDLLQGINGQNGIVVVPMSDLKDSGVVAGNGELTLKQSGSSDEVVVAATTTEAPVTRRRRPGRRRRPTTRAPDHIRTSLSDLWYAKGQWFGTLLGGMIDLGRIAMEAFRERSGSSSRDSYSYS